MGVGFLAFCEKDEPISVERFFQTVGLVLAWESIVARLITWRFLFVHVSSKKLTCHKDIRTNITHLPFLFKKESFKVNVNFKRLKINV